MTQPYAKFEDIEKELMSSAPQRVYKYRTWTDKFHQAFLKDQVVWFSHPFELNDPLDVRPEVVFDTEEICSQDFFESVMVPQAQGNTDDERKAIAQYRWREIMDNPDRLFENLADWNTDREVFDHFGVFSTSASCLIEMMWNRYADNSAGYCLGFDTIELCRQMNCGCGLVQYSDAPYTYRFLDGVDHERNILYQKKSKWKEEAEFRFITLGIGTWRERQQIIDTGTVSELVLGQKITPSHEAEILRVVKRVYPKDIPIFRIKTGPHGSLVKEEIV